MQRTDWERVRDILISIICIGIILWAGWSVISQFLHAVVLLLLSTAVAFLVTPIVNFLEKNRVPRVPATLIVFAFGVIGLGLLGYALVFSLINQVQYFSSHLPSYIFTLPTTYTSFLDWLVQQGIPRSNIDDALNQLTSQVQAFANSLVSNALNIVFLVGDAFINITLIIVLSFYFAVDGQLVRDNLISIAPRSWMPHVTLFEEALHKVVGNYIRGQLLLAAIVGVLAGMGSGFLGLSQFGLIIGVMGFLFETIPMVGPFLASIPAIAISLLLPDPFPRTFYIIAYFILIQMLESNILGPRIVGHAVGLHPIASIFALIIGAQLFGAFGALLATPIVAAAWVLIASLYTTLIRGETPEQMLSKRRSPWIRRRSHDGQVRGRRVHPVEGGSGTGELTTITAPVKGFTASAKIEHIDLIRPVSNSAEEREGIELT